MQTYQKKLHSQLNELIKEIISDIQSNNEKWIKTWTILDKDVKNFFTNRNYNGFNMFYLSYVMVKKSYKTPYFLTYKQIQKLGGRLNKGSKSIPIFFYKPLEIEDEILTLKDEKNKKTIPMLCLYKVFNIEDTKGIDYSLSEGITNKFYKNINLYINNLDIKINFNNFCDPHYDVLKDEIFIPDIKKFKNSDNFYATLMHEIVHSTGSKKRLNRKINNKFGDYDYMLEELIAETGSAFICSKFNIDCKNLQTSLYIKSWINIFKKKPQILWKIFSQVGKVAEYLNSFQK